MGNGKKGSNRKKTLILFFAVMALLVIAGAGSTYYAGTNDFCGSCHQMKTRYERWKKSTHNNVDCVTCHSEPGIVGELKAHVDGLKYLKSFLKGKTGNITIFAARGNPARLKSCIYCHPADTLKKETETLRVNHVSHITREGSLCTDCHAGMIHDSRGPGEVSPEEKKCIACHMREGARLDCRGCHIKKVDRRGRQLYVLDDVGKTIE